MVEKNLLTYRIKYQILRKKVALFKGKRVQKERMPLNFDDFQKMLVRKVIQGYDTK